jgi:hypothetical protein
MHSMHARFLRMGGRKSAVILMVYKVFLNKFILNGVQGVASSNLAVPTKKFNKKSKVENDYFALFLYF